MSEQKNKEKLVFIHIPKTAGSAFGYFLRSAYDEEEIFPYTLASDYEKIQFADTKKYSLYTGHMGFLTAEKINAHKITFLRNPIDRIVSLYYFFRQMATNATIDRPVQSCMMDALKYDLVDFINLNSDEVLSYVRNGMSWQLAFDTSPEIRDEYDCYSDDNLYKKAIENMEKLDFVGITEMMPLSIEMFKDKFSLYKDKQITRKNTTLERPPFKNVPLTLRKEIMKFVEVDFAVYDYAIRNFEKINVTLEKNND